MPFEALGPALAGIGAAVKTAEFAYALDNCESMTGDYLDILNAIQIDLHEAIRLRNLPATAKSLAPDSLQRIDNVITSSRKSLDGVARLVEKPRTDLERKGGVKLGNRFLWVVRDSQNIQTKQVLLSTCHNSLLSVIAEMKTVEYGQAQGQRRRQSPRGWDGKGSDDEEGEELRRALIVRHFRRRVEERGGRVVEEEAFEYTEQRSSAPFPEPPAPPSYSQACGEYDPAAFEKEVVTDELHCDVDDDVAAQAMWYARRFSGLGGRR